MDNEIPLPPPRKIRHRSPAANNNNDATGGDGRGLPFSSSPFFKPQRPSRSRLDDLSSIPSSDPAFFSSDDIPSSSLENYKAVVRQESKGNGNGNAHSRKRRYRGTWWGEVAMEAKRKRGDFRDKRHLDSGIWMGSDGSSSENLLTSEDTSCEEYLQSLPNGKEKKAPPSMYLSVSGNHPADGAELNDDHHSFVADSQQHKPGVESLEHRVARDLIDTFVEEGQDSIDLSNRGLKTIPPGLLQPLQHLTKQPPVDRPPVTDDVFASLTPFLRLWLSGNGLMELTSDLFELSSLKVLSLRNNKLREIPSAIRHLTMLQELNVSVNKLQYLPWEILWLIKKGDLKQMVVHPNRFVKFDPNEVEKWHYTHAQQDKSPVLRSITYEGPPPEESWAPIHVATGRVQRFDSEGLPLPSTVEAKLKTKPSSSRVPSLRELALLESIRFPYLDQFLNSEEASNCPDLVVRLLHQARSVRNGGGRSCSVCHRNFVIARSEWIEWWDCATYENGLKGPRPSGAELRPLPFIRRTCSWACVPSEHEDEGKQVALRPKKGSLLNEPSY